MDNGTIVNGLDEADKGEAPNKLFKLVDIDDTYIHVPFDSATTFSSVCASHASFKLAELRVPFRVKERTAQLLLRFFEQVNWKWKSMSECSVHVTERSVASHFRMAEEQHRRFAMELSMEDAQALMRVADFLACTILLDLASTVFAILVKSVRSDKVVPFLFPHDPRESRENSDKSVRGNEND